MSGNLLATAAGIKTLEVLGREGVFEQAQLMAEQLATGLRSIAADTGIDMVVEQVGTMLTVFFAETLPKNFGQVAACDHERFGRFHQSMLNAGVYLPPSGYEAWFVSAAHTQADVDRTLECARLILST